MKGGRIEKLYKPIIIIRNFNTPLKSNDTLIMQKIIKFIDDHNGTINQLDEIYIIIYNVTVFYTLLKLTWNIQKERA